MKLGKLTNGLLIMDKSVPYYSHVFYSLQTSWPVQMHCSKVTDVILNFNCLVVHSRNCTSPAYSACYFNAAHDRCSFTDAE